MTDLEQLVPKHAVLDPGHAYSDLGLAERALDSRPYLVANMVSTADGRATFAGRTREISSDLDRELFLDLRTQVDAVMVGTATIAIEGYGPLIRSEERRERRRKSGLDPVPLAITATRSMELPVQAPLFQDEDSRVVVLTNSDREPPACPADLIVERFGGEELDMLAAMECVRHRHAVRSVLLEGGPTLLAAMLGAGLVDELFLTLAAKLVGSGAEVAVVEGAPLAAPLELELRSLLRHESYLFLRYGIAPRARR